MASTTSGLRKVADDILDILRSTGGEGGPHMHALMVKHRKRQAEVIERIRARDVEGAERALTDKAGHGRSLLQEMNRAHRQDRALDVALFGGHDLAGYVHAVRRRDGREGPVTLAELRATPIDREVLANALKHELGEKLDLQKLGERELEAYVSEALTQQALAMLGIDPAAESAAESKKAVKEAVTPMVNEIAELYREHQ